MPDKRTHRGAHPDDAALFSTEKLAVLRSAVADLSLLLTRGYADKSALKLVGDRYGLRQRQRTAVMRSSCADANLEARLGRMLGRDALEGRVIGIDGYNVLITLESALAGGLLLRGRDGCLRDLASIHGTYRRVTETALALEHAGRFLEEGGAAGSLWLLDRPVSNSGRLKKLMEDLARENEWPWEVRLVRMRSSRRGPARRPRATARCSTDAGPGSTSRPRSWRPGCRTPGSWIWEGTHDEAPVAIPSFLDNNRKNVPGGRKP
jgi:hypothetical protein